MRVRMLSERARTNDIQDDAIIWGSSAESVRAALEFLHRYPHISKLKLIKRSRDGHMVRISVSVRRQICPLYCALQFYSAKDRDPTMERVDYDGRTTWTLDTKRIDRVTDMLFERFQIRDIQTSIRPEKDGMKKSLFLLKEAYERGYFDVPRRTSLRRVARDIGVPVSTLSTDVRRTLKGIVDGATK